MKLEGLGAVNSTTSSGIDILEKISRLGVKPLKVINFKPRKRQNKIL